MLANSGVAGCKEKLMGSVFYAVISGFLKFLLSFELIVWLYLRTSKADEEDIKEGGTFFHCISGRTLSASKNFVELSLFWKKKA